MLVYTYQLGAELRPITFDVYKDYPLHEELEELAGGTWSASVKVVLPSAPTVALFTKTTGITLSNTSPSVTLGWATSGELNSLTAGTRYHAYGRLTRTSDGRNLDLPVFALRIKATPH